MMKATQVETEQKYEAFSSLLSHPFIGKVVKKGEHSVIMTVEKASPDDSLRVNDLGSIIAVAYKDLVNKVKE